MNPEEVSTAGYLIQEGYAGAFGLLIFGLFLIWKFLKSAFWDGTCSEEAQRRTMSLRRKEKGDWSD